MERVKSRMQARFCGRSTLISLLGTALTLKFDKANGTGHHDQHWLLELIRNSCSSDLWDIIDETFNELPVHQQGGSVYLKLIYDIVFNMTEPVIHMLLKWGGLHHPNRTVNGLGDWFFVVNS